MATSMTLPAIAARGSTPLRITRRVRTTSPPTWPTGSSAFTASLIHRNSSRRANGGEPAGSTVRHPAGGPAVEGGRGPQDDGGPPPPARARQRRQDLRDIAGRVQEDRRRRAEAERQQRPDG